MQFPSCLLLLLLLLSLISIASGIAVAGFRRDYAPDTFPEPLTREQLLQQLQGWANDTCNTATDDVFFFPRFQSPQAILRMFDGIRRRPSSFHIYQGPDGRHGSVSTTKLLCRGGLGGMSSDWVLAESQQVAVQCTPEEVLSAYLSGALQTKWNRDKVLECRMTLIQQPKQKNNNSNENNNDNNQNSNEDNRLPFYQQDLVLKSQRVIRSRTGIMRYSQKITIDRIGDDNNKYSVSIQLMNPATTTSTTKATTTRIKPFEALTVYVNLEPDGANNVNIYAAGLFKVNRNVVPNLVIFDASGIAAGMAGKGTLWLAAYFKQRQQQQQALSQKVAPKTCLSHAPWRRPMFTSRSPWPMSRLTL